MQFKGLILLYHRVADMEHDPQLLCVSPVHFEEHLAVLREHTTPAHLHQLCRMTRRILCPDRAVFITFDDGYADCLHNAKSILERYDVPATVFVTTGAVGSSREFWWDELARLLLSPGSLPETLDINVGEQRFHWQLGSSALYTDTSWRENAHWNVTENRTPSERHALYQALCAGICPLPPRERETVLTNVRSWVGATLAGRPEYRAINATEIRQLVQGGLVDVGAHTVSHTRLSALPRDVQRAEIVNSKTGLERILGRPVTSFSYPFGCPSDYTHETVTEVRSAGFALACSNFPALVTRRTSRWELPRFLVRDWDGDLFLRLLEEWFGH